MFAGAGGEAISVATLLHVLLLDVSEWTSSPVVQGTMAPTWRPCTQLFWSCWSRAQRRGTQAPLCPASTTRYAQRFLGTVCCCRCPQITSNALLAAALLQGLVCLHLPSLRQGEVPDQSEPPVQPAQPAHTVVGGRICQAAASHNQRAHVTHAVTCLGHAQAAAIT